MTIPTHPSPGPTTPQSRPPSTAYAPSTPDHAVLIVGCGLDLWPRSVDVTRLAVAGRFDEMRQEATNLMDQEEGRTVTARGSYDMPLPDPGTLLLVWGPPNSENPIVATYWVTHSQRMVSGYVGVICESAPEYTALIGTSVHTVLAEGVATSIRDDDASETEWANAVAERLICVDNDARAALVLAAHRSGDDLRHEPPRRVTLDPTTAHAVRLMAERTGKSSREVIADAVRRMPEPGTT